ncbi:hypothetical protein EVAR_7365_1 [Eumeta japonica]|uniref:Uncharacterized protein n=1 Tax=Eumeta variegata TaxID=151549 RepID=A0A4C1V8H2_EUMVA|nr:hypothetical protein EVAR_7365_1 [Eumeta japonica]
MERRKEFEFNINIEETMRLREQLYCEEEDLRQLDNKICLGAVPEPPPFSNMYADPDSNINGDLATLSRLRAISKRLDNSLSSEALQLLQNSSYRPTLKLLMDWPTVPWKKWTKSKEMITANLLRFQRNEIRNAGVAIYNNQKNRCHIVTPHLDIKAPYSVSTKTASQTKIEAGFCEKDAEIQFEANFVRDLKTTYSYQRIFSERAVAGGTSIGRKERRR